MPVAAESGLLRLSGKHTRTLKPYIRRSTRSPGEVESSATSMSAMSTVPSEPARRRIAASACTRSAAHVSDADIRSGAQAVLDVGQRGQPVLPEQLQVRIAVQAALGACQVAV